jgi:acetolactate synthase small subunit
VTTLTADEAVARWEALFSTLSGTSKVVAKLIANIIDDLADLYGELDLATRHLYDDQQALAMTVFSGTQTGREVDRIVTNAVAIKAIDVQVKQHVRTLRRLSKQIDLDCGLTNNITYRLYVQHLVLAIARPDYCVAVGLEDTQL